MSDELEIKSGLCPYSDGSGFQLEVAISRTNKDSETLLSIITNHPIEARNWPEIKASIDQLFLAVPTPPAPGRE